MIEVVIDTNYRRLIDGRSIDISLGGIQNIVVGSDIDQAFQEKGYKHGVPYLVNLSERLFTNIELWLKTGVIAPKTTSLLERLY